MLWTTDIEVFRWRFPLSFLYEFLAMDQQQLRDLRVLADKLRIDSIRSTNASKSG